MLANCSRCGKVFVSSVGKVCPSCAKEVEREFILCSQFLREHPDSTVQDVHEGTGVSISQIEAFIKEGRFEMKGHEQLTYTCERCGRRIRTGRFCVSCYRELLHEVQRVSAPSAPEATQAKKPPQTKGVKDTKRYAIRHIRDK